MASGGWTIAVDDSARGLRKITKILQYGDGGFSVLAPYHAARRGSVGKWPVADVYGRREGKWIAAFEVVSYSAEDQVKLSYHPDGFVQFSGVRGGTIRSGRSVDGSPKGVAIFSNPLRTPISPGPSFGVQVWGLKDFDTYQPGRDRAVVFENDEVNLGAINNPPKPNGYALDGYVIASKFRKYVTSRRGKPFIDLVRRYAHLDEWQQFQLHVIDWRNPDYFLGLSLTTRVWRLKSASGFVLGGPADRQGQFGISAQYPPLFTGPALSHQPEGAIDPGQI